MFFAIKFLILETNVSAIKFFETYTSFCRIKKRDENTPGIQVQRGVSCKHICSEKYRLRLCSDGNSYRGFRRVVHHIIVFK